VGNSEYDALNQKFTIVVAKAPLTVTSNAATKKYGETIQSFTGTISGIVNADNISVTRASEGSVNNKDVGAYDIIATLVDPDNKLEYYSVSHTKGTLTVTKAPLKVEAVDVNIIYGGEKNFGVAYT